MRARVCHQVRKTLQLRHQQKWENREHRSDDAAGMTDLLSYGSGDCGAYFILLHHFSDLPWPSLEGALALAISLLVVVVWLNCYHLPRIRLEWELLNPLCWECKVSTQVKENGCWEIKGVGCAGFLPLTPSRSILHPFLPAGWPIWHMDSWYVAPNLWALFEQG